MSPTNISPSLSLSHLMSFSFLNSMLKHQTCFLCYILPRLCSPLTLLSKTTTCFTAALVQLYVTGKNPTMMLAGLTLNSQLWPSRGSLLLLSSRTLFVQVLILSFSPRQLFRTFSSLSTLPPPPLHLHFQLVTRLPLTEIMEAIRTVFSDSHRDISLPIFPPIKLINSLC